MARTVVSQSGHYGREVVDASLALVVKDEPLRLEAIRLGFLERARKALDACFDGLEDEPLGER